MTNEEINKINKEVIDWCTAHPDIISKINEGCPIIECKIVVTEADIRKFAEMGDVLFEKMQNTKMKVEK